MRKRSIQIALIFSVFAFVLYHSLLVPSGDFPTPTAIQRWFLMILAGIEALSFGCGITFAVYGKRVVENMIPGNRRHGYILYGSIIWLLVAWLPYNLLSMNVGISNVMSFLILSYLFQATLIAAAVIVAFYFLHPFLSQEKK